MPRRREQPEAMALEQMTDKELVGVYYFSTHPTYVVQTDDWRRAHDLLHERGYFERDASERRTR